MKSGQLLHQMARSITVAVEDHSKQLLDGLHIKSVSYTPALSLLASESLLFLVAFVASLEPRRRASKTDPLETIRAI